MQRSGVGGFAGLIDGPACWRDGCRPCWDQPSPSPLISSNGLVTPPRPFRTSRAW